MRLESFGCPTGASPSSARLRSKPVRGLHKPPASFGFTSPSQLALPTCPVALRPMIKDAFCYFDGKRGYLTTVDVNGAVTSFMTTAAFAWTRDPHRRWPRLAHDAIRGWAIRTGAQMGQRQAGHGRALRPRLPGNLAPDTQGL